MPIPLIRDMTEKEIEEMNKLLKIRDRCDYLCYMYLLGNNGVLKELYTDNYTEHEAKRSIKELEELIEDRQEASDALVKHIAGNQ